jgi:hypothetical protein
VAEIIGPFYALHVQPYLSKEIAVVRDVLGDKANEFAETPCLIGCEPISAPGFHRKEFASKSRRASSKVDPSS